MEEMQIRGSLLQGGEKRSPDRNNQQKTSLLQLLLIVYGERSAVNRQDLFS